MEIPPSDQEPAAPFQLEDQAPAAELGETDRRRLDTRSRYDHPLAWYSTELLGGEVSVGTVKRWIRIGREDGDRLPLDDPGALAAWYERHMKWKVPEVLQRLRGKLKSGAPIDEKAAPDQEAEVPGAQSPGSAAAAARLAEARSALGDVETGFAAALKRVEDAEALAFARWKVEIDRPAEEFNPNAERDRRKAHDEALSKLRQMQSGAGKILAESSDFARWDEVAEVQSEFAAALRAGLTSLLLRVANEVRIPPKLLKLMSPVFASKLDGVFSAAGAGGFAEPLELEAEVLE